MQKRLLKVGRILRKYDGLLLIKYIRPDLKQICEHQGFKMDNVTLEVTSPSASESLVQEEPSSLPTAIRLTSVAYASLYIHSELATPTVDGSLSTSTATSAATSSTEGSSLVQQVTGTAAHRKHLHMLKVIPLVLASVGLVGSM